ncbi:hypothetical protein CRYUN_Cryun09bG0207600 [Craigia yunnanensis]
MEGGQNLVAISLLSLAFSIASASDPNPLQDFCVAIKDAKNGVLINGKFCKDPKFAKAEDFFFSGLKMPENTIGISLARIDYAPYGLNPPHTHPRAAEILVVLGGTLCWLCYIQPG